MARKMIERLLRPVIAWVHIIAFMMCLAKQSPIA